MLKRIEKYVAEDERGIEQINGREGETVTFLSRGFVSLSLRVGGFAPRHLSRYAPANIVVNFALGELNEIFFYSWRGGKEHRLFLLESDDWCFRDKD